MKADWSRPLPRPIVIPQVMTIKTLADVRELMRHVPAARRKASTWQYVAARLAEATRGVDAVDVSIALQMVLQFEEVSYFVKKKKARPA